MNKTTIRALETVTAGLTLQSNLHVHPLLQSAEILTLMLLFFSSFFHLLVTSFSSCLNITFNLIWFVVEILIVSMKQCVLKLFRF